MGWDPAVVPDPQDPATFTRSKLDWAEASEGDHARLLDLYRALIRLRRSTPDLTALGFEATEAEFDDDARWLRFRRGGVQVLLNFAEQPVTLDRAGAELLLATDDAVRIEGGKVELPGLSAAVLGD